MPSTRGRARKPGRTRLRAHASPAMAEASTSRPKASEACVRSARRRAAASSSAGVAARLDASPCDSCDTSRRKTSTCAGVKSWICAAASRCVAHSRICGSAIPHSTSRASAGSAQPSTTKLP